MGIACYMVRPTARLMLASVNDGASLTDANSVIPAIFAGG